MTVKKGQMLELSIPDVAFGGKGIAKVDGFAVFVDHAVPGDRALVQVTRKKKNHAHARMVELLDPSPHRVPAPCPYSGYCGGCKWQHLSYEWQLVYKRKQVEDSVKHLAGLTDVPVHYPIVSPRVFHYRNKMEFSCSDRRWLLPSEMANPTKEVSFALGLHVPGTFYKVLDIDSCLLQPQLGDRIVSHVRSFIRNSRIPVYGLRSHEGFWRFLMLRHSVSQNHWMVNIITSSSNQKVLQPLADQLIGQYPQIASVVNNVTARKAGTAVGEFENHLAGQSVLKESIGRFQFEISANSFFQTNSLGAAKLYETVKKYCRLTGSERVLDLYSGAGTIPVCLSHQAVEVIGMEIVESAVDNARRNCRLNGVENCRFILGDIRKNLSAMDIKPDVMVIDPPRDGMHKDVVKTVIGIGPPRIVYVSCNPATLARDLSVMKEHYRIVEIQPVDMFPHTFHIESVTLMKRKHHML